MDKQIREWLLEEKNPEVRLRVLKEGLGYDDENEEVIATKESLKKSRMYAGVIKKLHAEKKWTVYDAFLALAEWGCTRKDVGKELDEAVNKFIEENGFQVLCGEPLLLRNLVKLGYGDEPIIKKEIENQFTKIKDDGGFGCISKNKKINDPKKPHKSCARFTVCYLLLAAELKLKGIEVQGVDKLTHYFMRRNIFYRSDNNKKPMVDVMMETFFPGDPIKMGVQYIVYALKILGCPSDSEAMIEGYRVMDNHCYSDGRYILSGIKSVPAFKAGKKNEPNKWITFYAYMAKEGCLAR